MTLHSNNIVVGVDDSISALHAVRWAAAQAERRGVSLRLVHAYELPFGQPSGFTVEESALTSLRDHGHRLLARARDTAAEAAPDLRPEIVLEAAPVVSALTNESRTASMLVLGTRGRNGLTGLLVGSTSIALAGQSHCPIVIVRGCRPDEPAPERGPVVVGVDGTPTSEAAIAFAFEEASARGADLIAVHTWTESILDTALAGQPETPDSAPRQQHAYEILAERLAGWPEKYPDVHVTREVVRERATRALLRYAQTAQLVVVGCRGRGGFRSLVLGSTSQHLLHHAPCPVAVVRTESME